MALKGVALTVQYVAWDTSSNTGKTGDVANHTLRVIKDGTAAAPTNSPSEIDATNCPGIYKLDLTAGEMTCSVLTLAGKSATANVVIIPLTIITEGGRLDVAVSSRMGAGSGAITWTYTLTNSVTGAPIADADVWVTSDLAGANFLASGKTNQNGVVTFYLDAGTVYVWRQKTGFNFTNPDTEVVS